MPILTKDGKEYRTFSEPNPLSKNQEFVEKSELKFYNFNHKSQSIEKSSKKIEIPKTDIEDFVKSLSIPEKIEETVENIIHEIVPNVKQEEKKESEYMEIPDSQILLIHVLPVKILKQEDELYGETRDIKEYGKKFEIDSLLIEMSDLAIQILTDSKLDINYILYPSKYKNGTKSEINRWWRVTKVEHKDENYLVNAVLTNFHPSFER